MMKELREKNNIDVGDVKEIRIDAGKIALDAAGKVAPKTGLEGKFSTYYCAAVALVEGGASPDKFTDEKVNDPRLVALRQKVKISVPEPDLGFALRAVIQMKDGTEYSASTDAPKGDPANPVSYDELAEKFRGLTRNVIPKENVDQLINKIKTLDQVSDIDTLLDLCS
jgi:2-methylcitrate dehydratase PrpD